MPFKAPEQIKCPKCGKSVYAAESRVVGDLSFHKECFKCSMCNKMLDSTNQNCHEAVLYCKTCHGRKYGPKGYGFGGGAAGLSMDTGAHLDGRTEGFGLSNYKPPKAPPGEGCPRCGGRVYAAEEMLAKGKAYHKTCFNCKTCRKPLDSMLHCDGPDKEVYCRGCYGNKFGPQGYGFGHGAGTLTSKSNEFSPMVRPHGNPDFVMQAKEGQAACPRCGGIVYSAEMMMAKDRGFHKKCFKCLCCRRPLDSMTHCDGTDGEVYCKLCYAKKYGPKGYGFAAGAGGVLTAENIPGGEEMNVTKSAACAAIDVSKIQAAAGEGCPRCGGKVFMAEEINARGRSFHKRCYNCCNCHRPLDSVVGCDSPDGEVYCKLCYAKKYGPKGYGFAAGGGGVLTAENIVGGEASLQVKQVSDFARLDVSKIRAKEGEGCPRCGGKVFMAEEMHVRDRSFHKRCYNCCHCHRPLDSMTGCDSPDGEVYCKLCYAKKYGPKGYGFAAGGGGVLTAENIPGGDQMGASVNVNPTFAAIDTTCIRGIGEENCPRCGGKVFSAEERLSGGGIKWHKRCYSCKDCHRPLDSMVLCDGPDGDIYCRLCYAKRFGPKGYGFAAGSGGVLVPENIDLDDDEQVIVRSQYNINAAGALDVSRIKAKEGQSRCPRCGGAVFQAEAIPVRGKQWHKPCYNCVECHRPLDSMTGNDAPDGEVYCRLCYAKRHGPKGYGYGHCPSLISLGNADGIPIPTDIRQFGFGPKLPTDWVPPGAFLSKNIEEQKAAAGKLSSETNVQTTTQQLPGGGQVTRTVTQVKTEIKPVVSGVRLDASGKPVQVVSGVVSETDNQNLEEDGEVEIVYEEIEVEEGEEGEEEIEYVEEIVEEEAQSEEAGAEAQQEMQQEKQVQQIASHSGEEMSAEMQLRMAAAQNELSEQMSSQQISGVSSSQTIRIQSSSSSQSSSSTVVQKSFSSSSSGMISSQFESSDGGEVVTVQESAETSQE